MGLIVKKRQLILATLIVALGAAVFVNWYYTRPNANLKPNTQTEMTTVVNLGDAQLVNAPTSNNEYFASAKLKRTTAHDEALQTLNDIIKDASSSTQAVSSAQKKLEKISSDIKVETDVENAITAKLGSNCLVTINDDKAQVIVNKNTLNDTTSTQIIDIVTTQTDVLPENITLIETK